MSEHVLIAPEDDRSKRAQLILYFEGERAVVQVERDVVVQARDVVDGSNVVGPRLQLEAGPIELLGRDDMRDVVAQVHAAERIRPVHNVHLNELLFHISKLRPPTQFVATNNWKTRSTQFWPQNDGFVLQPTSDLSYKNQKASHCG